MFRQNTPLLALGSLLLILCLSLQACASNSLPVIVEVTRPPLPTSSPTAPPTATPEPIEILPTAAPFADPFLLQCQFEAGRALQIASYCMDVQLDPEHKEVKGVAQITYLHASLNALNEVWLHLYLRAFRDRDSVWMREAGGRHRGHQLSPKELGDITVHALTLEDGTDLLASSTISDTLMRVPLPKPLRPGERLVLEVHWTSKLPRVFARTGYGGRNDTFLMVGQWYPKMAVYDRGRWDTEPWHTNAEFFHDFGSYDVSISAPAEYRIAATGRPIGDLIVNGAMLTQRYRASDVNDFAFAASPDFQTETVDVDGTEVVLFYLPEHESVVSDYLTSASESLRYFNDWFGKYPHPRLTIVDVPNDASGAGGMEYPTLVTVGTFGLAKNSGFVPMVTAHEIAHQWWPMQVASHEGREPWLDEGLAEYASMRFLAETGRHVDLYGQSLDAELFERRQYNGARLPANLPAWEYSSQDYGVAVYFKTAVGLWTLESLVGRERLHEAMATYVERQRFKHPTSAEFRNTLEQHLGDLSWFFDDYIGTDGVIEFVAGPIENGEEDSVAYVQRVGAVRVPVEVRVTFKDGSQRIETWDAQDERIGFHYTQPVQRIEVDPEEKLVAEMVRSNNSARAP